jgi:membrane protease YdiL (CAAX protease family)
MLNLQQLTPSSGYPALRTALIVYLVVTFGTVALTVSLNTGAIEITFLRLAAAVFVVLGVTVGALIITGVQPQTVVGKAPKPIHLITGFLGGLAAWIPATWLLAVFSQTLGGIFGNLPASQVPQTSSGLTITGLFILFGLILPLCQGFLFFGYLQTAARAIGKWRGVWLIAVLYGVFGLFSAARGVSAIPPYFVIGLVGATLTLRSGSAFSGVLVLSGFNLGEPIWQDLTRALQATQDILSIQWVSAVLLSGFAAFLLVQFSRIFTPSDLTDLLAKTAPTRRLWWIPLIAVGLFAAVIISGEIVTRSANRVQLYRPTSPTNPPIAPTATRP